MPLDLTVDVGVVMSASGLGAAGHREASLGLLKAIESRAQWLLALDSRGRIRYQYEEKVKQGFGEAWLRRLASTNRIAFVTCRKLDRGTVTRLKEDHFDPEDFKYVHTAASTQCKKLISHDPDYSHQVRKTLKRVDVEVLTAEEAIAL